MSLDVRGGPGKSTALAVRIEDRTKLNPDFLRGVASSQLNSDEYGLSSFEMIIYGTCYYNFWNVFSSQMELVQTMFEFHGTSSLR